MKATNKSYNGALINFLLIVFQIGFLLCGLGIGLYVLYTIIALLSSDSIFPVGLPVVFSLDHSGVFNLPGHHEVFNFNMSQGMGIIGVDHLPKDFVALHSIITVLGVTCVLLSLKLTIAILEAVKQGGFLIIENAIRLRGIALLSISTFFIERLASFASSFYLSDKLHFSGLEFTSINFYSFFNTQSIFYSLFLLVIAEAFRIGALLKQESDLTI